MKKRFEAVIRFSLSGDDSRDIIAAMVLKSAVDKMKGVVIPASYIKAGIDEVVIVSVEEVPQ